MRRLSFVIVMMLSCVVHAKKEKASTEPAAAKITQKKMVAAKNVDVFATPFFLEPHVQFWANIYREWDTHQVVIYDSVSKSIYRIIDLPRLEFTLSASKFRGSVQAEIKDVQSIIERIVDGELPSKKSGASFAQIYDSMKRANLIKESAADLNERMRNQSGLRSQFEYGLKKSGRYADDMKAILRSQELPDELLAVVFVESLFNLSAQSHAGASGPWGIMRETAISHGIFVNKFTDERIDPVVATLGAARYLKKAKENLTEWPLAITSYNYGYPGTLRAVKNVGSKDFADIIAKHESPIFKYASKNYYAEFLAALDTLRNQHKYFPDLKKESPWQYEVVQVQRALAVDDMLSSGAISKDDLAKLNPSLTRMTLTGLEVIPADYALRVPKGKSSHFYARIKKIPSSKRHAASLKVSSKFQARGRETLALIAKNFGISAEFLSERMGKPRDYRPKGPVIIRSQSHLFSPLIEINKGILATVSSGQALEKPPEIGKE